jgi:uncharacterized protein (DUF1697 family)
MKKYVAFLRGINVGGNKKVEMPKLKKVFESLGYSQVSTYINTGNVMFETEQKEVVKTVESALRKTFGFEIRVVIRESKNIKNLCKKIPREWENNADQKTDVLFLWDEFDTKESLKLIASTPVDNLRYIDGALIWNVKRTDQTKSGMNTFIGTKLYKHMTARNVNTVRKLGEMVGASVANVELL